MVGTAIALVPLRMNETHKTLSQLPTEHRPVFVLLEDEQIFRMMWQIEARLSGGRLVAFETVEQLLAAEPELPSEAVFLLDNDLMGSRDAGRRVAAMIRNRRSDSTIILQTSHPQSTFTGELNSGVVNAIFGKSPNLLAAEEAYRMNNKQRKERQTNE